MTREKRNRAQRNPPRAEGADAPASAGLSDLRACCAVALLALFAFLPALGNVPIYDDDAQFNAWPAPRSAGEWLAGFAEPWWPDEGTQQGWEWRPLTRLAIQAQRMADGGGPAAAAWPMYLVNLGLHAAVCALLFLAARRWLPLPGAAAAAALFAVHPLHAEAVHQIVGRAELMAAGWMLCGLIAFARNGTESRASFWQQPLFLALALGSKEHAVLYPFYLGLAAVARDGRVAVRCAALLSLLVAVDAAFVFQRGEITGFVLSPPDRIMHEENVLAGYSPALRVPAALGGLGYAAAKFIFPAFLSPDYSAYSLDFASGWRWPYAWLGLAICAALLVLASRSFMRGGKGWTLAAAGTAGWLLTSNLLFLVGTSPAPRLWYWPSAAACLGAGWLAQTAISRFPAARKAIGASAGAVVLAFLCMSLGNSRQWRTTDEFSRATLRVFPRNWRAHRNLASQASNRRDYRTALVHARAATELLPGEIQGWEILWYVQRHTPGLEKQADDSLRRLQALSAAQP